MKWYLVVETQTKTIAGFQAKPQKIRASGLTSTFPGSPQVMGNAAAAQTQDDPGSLAVGLKPQPGVKMAARH